MPTLLNLNPYLYLSSEYKAVLMQFSENEKLVKEAVPADNSQFSLLMDEVIESQSCFHTTQLNPQILLMARDALNEKALLAEKHFVRNFENDGCMRLKWQGRDGGVNVVEFFSFNKGP